VPGGYPTVGAAQAAGAQHILLSGDDNDLDLNSTLNQDRPTLIEGSGFGASFTSGQMATGTFMFQNLTFQYGNPAKQAQWMSGGNSKTVHVYVDCEINGTSTANPNIKGGGGGEFYMIDSTVMNVYSWEYPRYVQRCSYAHYLADIMKSGFLNIFTETDVTFHGNVEGNDIPEGFAVHTDFWQSNFTGTTDYTESNIVFSHNEAWNNTVGQLIFGNFARRENEGYNVRLVNMAVVENALASFAGLGSSEKNRANMISYGMPGQNWLIADNAFFGAAAFSGQQDETTGQLLDPNGPNEYRFTNVLWANNYRSFNSTEYTMPSPDGPAPHVYISGGGYEGRFVEGTDTFPFLSPLSGVFYINDDGDSFTKNRKSDNWNNTTFTPYDV